MHFRFLVGTLVIFFVIALIRKPFKHRAKFKELTNHLILSLCTYYVCFVLLSYLGLEQNKSMAIAVGVTAVVLLVVNIFFRKV